MKARTRIAGIAAGVALVALVAASASAAGTAPAQMSPAEHAAMVRGQALNVLYGLGKPEGMTHAQYRALLIRSTALNELHGLPVGLSSSEVARMYGRGIVPSPTLATPVAVPRGDGFDWVDAAIGAAFAAGLALLGVAGALAVRHHGHMPQLRH